MKTDRVEFAAGLTAALLLAIFALAGWLGLPQLWGLNLGKFVSPLASVLVLVAALLLLRRRWSTAVTGRLDRLAQQMAQRKTLRIGVVLAGALGLTVLFALFHSVTMLLGDATLRLNQIEDGRLLLVTELGDYLLHVGLYRAILEPLGITVDRGYQLTSIIGGFVFVLGTWRLASYLCRSQALTVWLTMLTSGLTALFFGYIESYSLLAGLLPFMVLNGLKAVDGNARRTSFLIFYLAGGLIHSVSLWLFLGVLMVVWFLPPAGDRSDVRRLHRRLLAAFLLFLVGFYVVRTLGWFGLSRYLLPLWGREGSGLGLFTAAHARDLLNWLLLAGLPAVLLLPTLLGRVGELSPADQRRSLLATWLLLPATVLLVFLTPQLGGPRDWDLFSVPVFLLIPASILLYLVRRKRNLPAGLIPVIVVAAFNTISFGMINHSPTKAANRFVEIIEQTKFKNNALEYISLMGLAREFPELADRRLEFALKAWDEPVYKRSDTIRVLNYLDWITHYRDSSGVSPVNVPALLWADSNSLDRQFLLANYLLQFGHAAQLTDFAVRLQRLFPDDPQAYNYAALCYFKMGRLPECGACFERAYQLDGNDVAILVGYSAYLYEIKEYARAATLAEHAVQLNPSSFLANHNLALIYIELGRAEEAAKYLARAKDLISSESHARMLKRTLEMLKRRAQPTAGP